MPEPHERPRRTPSERALAIYRRHAIVGRRRKDVAKEFGCSPARVSRVCRAVSRWIREYGATVHVPALKAAHHLFLSGLVQEAVAEWERSKQPARVTKARMVQGRTDKNGTPQTVVTSEQIDREQCGNPRYLQLSNELLKSIRGIWGADAPRSAAIDDGFASLLSILICLEPHVGPIDASMLHSGNVIDFSTFPASYAASRRDD